MTYTEYIDLPPLMSARGTVVLPGSKSISNRVLLLAALADGVTDVRDLLRSDDTDRMLEGLQTLGIRIESLGGNDYKVAGCGGNFPVKDAELFLGNAGTAFRPLTAALALSGGNYTLSGVARMHERPIGDLVEALRALGANIDYLGVDGFPPLHIKPAMLSGAALVSVRGDVSSQFLTALLMALPLLRRAVTVEVIGELISKPYIEITLAMMARFGVAVQRDGWCSFTVATGSRYASPGVIYVEGDASSASYFLAAGALGGGPVRVEGVGKTSVQGDVRFAEALEKMGAVVSMGDNWIEACAPVDGRLKTIDLDCNHIPDAAMTLAVAALYAEGTTVLRNIASWRVKETDRIAAMATELRKVGATVEEGADYIKVTGIGFRVQGSSKNGDPGLASTLPPSPFSLPGSIDTYDDHRMAMCFSLAAFGAGIRINDPKCVGKTFPDYFAAFASVTQAVPVIAIDGPSASGKGTVAQRVAMQLGFHYLDSGALYRLLAMAAERDGVGLDDEAALAELAARIDIRFEGEQIWLDGVLAGDALRGEQCAAAASRVAALPLVRLALLNKQRAFRRAPGLVTDGRDMASVIFPDALHKVFLTASAEARAERRYKQLKEKGMDASMPDLLQDIRTRDERDTNRSAAPLQQSPYASLLDTTALNIEQAVESVLTGYRTKCLAP
ncbi:MAG: bifunctional 3-phosphoshikimate 1-carboxyvinyltransferase/cytidylate kinase [Gallionella sp.]|nr:bifunctional 3-phosphoshikimate 1-carboxyvinyltransferase/cytidylate kinase [Gallionella sp.]